MADQAGIINSTTGAIVPVNNALVEVAPGVWSLQATAPGYVPESRTISTTAPLTGGGDLSANRTIAMPAATPAVDGYMTAARAGIVDAFTAFGRSFGAAVDAAAAKLQLALVKGDVGLGNCDNTSDLDKPVSTAQATADGLRVLKTGDTMTGDLTIGSGKNLKLTGGAGAGQGCIVFGAAASPFWDSNVCIVDSSTKTMGYVCGTSAAFQGSSGPFFGMRGNTYTALASQRGILFFYAGKPTAPGANEGRIIFGTNDTERLVIDYNGTVKVANLTAGKPVYASTGGALTTTPQGQYSAIATKTANYTLTPTDCVIIGDTASGSFTLTLPTAVGYTGLTFTLKSSSAANVLSFATTSSQTVDGATTGPIPYPNAIKVISDGANWHVI